MPIPSKMVHAETEVDSGNKPVILRKYRDMPAAFVEESVLDDAGIECYLQDDNVVRMDLALVERDGWDQTHRA